MNIVLLQSKLHLDEIDLLLKEFPEFLFLSLNESAYRQLQKSQWNDVEIVYGNKFSAEDLQLAPNLRWIQTTGSQLNRINQAEIRKRGNIILTKTADENIYQVGEFVIGGLLAFAKNFIHWSEADHFPALLWDSKWRDEMWSLRDRTLLQIGLGSVGTEITRRAQQFDMNVWGMEEKKTFHPYCERNYSFKDLHSVLPAIDVVSIALPASKEYDNWFGEVEIEHMKDDSILSIIGPHSILNAESLVKHDQKGKLRGILLDAPFQTSIPQSSPLWQIKNKIITPEASPRPKSKDRQAFRLFVYNLRQYVHGNYKDLRNRVDLED